MFAIKLDAQAPLSSSNDRRLSFFNLTLSMLYLQYIHKDSFHGYHFNFRFLLFTAKLHIDIEHREAGQDRENKWWSLPPSNDDFDVPNSTLNSSALWCLLILIVLKSYMRKPRLRWFTRIIYSKSHYKLRHRCNSSRELFAIKIYATYTASFLQWRGKKKFKNWD